MVQLAPLVQPEMQVLLVLQALPVKLELLAQLGLLVLRVHKVFRA